MAIVNISVGDAKAKFSELISRAAAGERFVIRRRDKPVAAIIGTDDLERLDGRQKAAAAIARKLGHKTSVIRDIELGKVHPLLALYGTWENQPEWDEIAKLIYRNRRRKSKRPVVEL